MSTPSIPDFPRMPAGHVSRAKAGRAAMKAGLQAHCPQCDRQVRVTEPFAFGGMDKLRSTLACGHVVLRGE